ncbi:MAG: hypothetical protein A2V84_14180 [Chloroflexi bacterium RBG_16_70_13]|nr:MAG: hypothetical protein A2V84_14180 [Chloroflexi bacterium RBG_16_70_13]
MKKTIAPVTAVILALAAASSALAARPDVFRDRASGSEYDESVSWLCGFDVWLDYRTDFSIISSPDGAVTTFHAERFRIGPGGSLKQMVHYTWVPSTFEIIGDPESGSWMEVIREVAHGSRVWSTPDDGVIYREAGYYDATLTLTITPDGETFEISDEVAHGQQPGVLPKEEANALMCEALG